MSSITVYGIKNCDTVKKAISWLKENGVDFDFHNYKTKGISREKLEQWCGQVSWEELVNRKGTTWRKLDEAVKAGITAQGPAISLMSSQTSVIKRPVIERAGKVLVLGFDEEVYRGLLN